MKKYLLIFLCLLSCQEEISLDLPIESQKLVIEGGIEQGMPPYVVLTKNQGYFDEIDTNTYNNLFVTDAEIIVWTTLEDGTNDSIFLEKIPEYPFPIYTYLPYWYSLQNPPYAMEDPFFKNWSKPNRTYNLIVKWNNKEVTSQTTIPNPTPLDCLWIEKNEFANEDDKFDVRAIYNDPIDEQNNILIKNRRIEHWGVDSLQQNPQIKPKHDLILDLIDAGSDVLINGERFETYFPRKGKNSSIATQPWRGSRWKTFDNDGTLDSIEVPHDVALIKFCQIDESSLRFWRSIVRQFGSSGNPFQEPLNIVSNINGGYGGWTGYGAVYYKIPIIDGSWSNSPLPLDSIEITDVF